MVSFEKIIRVIRLKVLNKPGTLSKVIEVIAANEVNLGDIKVVRVGTRYITRDINVYVKTPHQFEKLIEEIKVTPNIKFIRAFDETYKAHEGGLLEIKSKVKIENMSDIEKYYLPGIARIAETIDEDKTKVNEYTNILNTVGVITNGSALLNFQESSSEAAYAVMESYSALLSEFVAVSPVPIVVETREKEKFVEVVENIHKSFGMIVLEDLSSPGSVDIEEALKEKLSIPVIDGNQYGNAIATVAGLINIAKGVNINLKECSVGYIGFGSKANGIHKLLTAYGVKETNAYEIKPEAIERVKKAGIEYVDDLNKLMQNSDIIIGTARIGGLIKFGMVKPGQIILSLSKPEPEIKPEIAMKAGAKYAGDGRLINPLLVIPGIVKGTLAARAKKITLSMMMEATNKLAEITIPGEILPSMFDEGLHDKIAEAVKQAAIDEGVANLNDAETDEESGVKDKAQDIFDKIRGMNEWVSS